MCGRYTLITDPEALAARYGVEIIEMEITPRYNIAPGQMVPVVVQGNMERKIIPFRWGLVPSFSKDSKNGYKMINARSETLLEKPSYRNLFLRRRCLIPADSLYEWKRDVDNKRPYRIMLSSGDTFSYAGLFDIWKDPVTEEPLYTCTIITTKPNALMADIHDRMPVILDKESEEIWLSREAKDPILLQKLLKSYDPTKMKAYRVSSIVGNVRNDSPQCIEEII